MTSPLLPTFCSRRLGAILTGRSKRAFGVIAEFIEDEAGRVPLASIEHILGEELTVELYLAGQRRLDARRTQERDRQVAKREDAIREHNAAIERKALEHVAE
jgi:hypothetical protein